MKRPHIVFDKPPSAGAHGLRRARVADAFARVRAFLDRCTDCRGAHRLSMVGRRLSDAQRARFPEAGTWSAGSDVTWSGTSATRPGDPEVVLSHDDLHALASELELDGAVSFEFLLRDPRTGARLPYDDADFGDYPRPWSSILLHAREGDSNQVSLELVFPFDEVNDTIVAVHDAVAETMGFDLAAKYWKLHRPAKQPGKYGKRTSIGFDRKAWIAPSPADEGAFLAQIAAAPDDDELRLVYADLLIARGDPRGELINVQCRLARLADDAPERKALAAAEKKLLKLHGKAWARVPKVVGATLRRGFVEHLRVQFASDLTDEVAEVAPLARELEIVVPFEVRDVGRLAAWPGAPRLRKLTLRCLTDDREPAIRAAIAAEARLAALAEVVIVVRGWGP